MLLTKTKKAIRVPAYVKTVTEAESAPEKHVQVRNSAKSQLRNSAALFTVQGLAETGRNPKLFFSLTAFYQGRLERKEKKGSIRGSFVEVMRCVSHGYRASISVNVFLLL